MEAVRKLSPRTQSARAFTLVPPELCPHPEPDCCYIDYLTRNSNPTSFSLGCFCSIPRFAYRQSPRRQQQNVSNAPSTSGMSARLRSPRRQQEQNVSSSASPSSEMSARVRNKRKVPVRRVDPDTADQLTFTRVSRSGRSHSPVAPRRSRSDDAQKEPPAKKRRPRSRFLREVRYYQRSTDLLISKLPFARVVRMITYQLFGPRADELRWQAVCFLALQEAAEAFVVELLESAQKCAIHARRVTVMPRDLRLVTDLRNIPTPQNRIEYRPV